MSFTLTTHNLGFPRIGAERELKTALEAYWRGDLDQAGLEACGRTLRQRHWQLQAEAGIELIPTGDFAWYDQVLTLSATLGNIPLRHRRQAKPAPGIGAQQTPEHGHCCGHESAALEFANQPCRDVDLDTLFRVARGQAPSGQRTSASDMTKWFDTNYHYLVPEFHREQTFALCWRQIIEETREAIDLGHKVKPVVLGPLSYLWLGKEKQAGFDRLELLDRLLPAYRELLAELKAAGASWVQIDEPILVLDLPDAWQKAFESCYNRLQTPGLQLLLASYFGTLGDNLSCAIQLPVAGLHLDAVRAPEQILTVIDRLPAHKILSLGVVDGRNIWRNNLRKSLALLQQAYERLGDRLWLAPSCSLLHCPVDLTCERQLPAEVYPWLAFARQKLSEVASLKLLLQTPDSALAARLLTESDALVQNRATSPRIYNPEVRNRLKALTPESWQRQSPFSQRITLQQARLQLPRFPTTSIGSFPQTREIRAARRQFKQGQLSPAAYQARIEAEIAQCIARQEQLGLDVLVHGEAERNDMVEYFGEQLEGFVFTDFGWVQSYGSRCVKPPIIVGDVSRPAPMTVPWASYAQSLSRKPVKGMLTGPITLLCWSFVRDDQPREHTALQLAQAIRDEVLDLEAAGIGGIQIDEPAIREGLPLRQKEHQAYLDWAVKAFRISASGVADQTQIHTHMCYSEFNDIIKAIADLDADVITIETSRSQGDLLQAFEDFQYPNDIGPGVYDIHSPNLPEIEEMVGLIEGACRRLPAERLWINPDCGLKTRAWPETEEALRRMQQAACTLRARYSSSPNSAANTAIS